MISNFRGKYTKDTEMPQESIIQTTSFINAFASNRKDSISCITSQQLNEDNFDNYIEKKK